MSLTQRLLLAVAFGASAGIAFFAIKGMWLAAMCVLEKLV